LENNLEQGMKKYENFKCFVIIISVFFQFILQCNAQSHERLIPLGITPIKFKNNNFYLIKILDERSDKRKIGVVFNENKEEIILNVAGGVLRTSNEYLAKFTSKNTSLYPIVLKIKELKVIEKITSPKLINGESNIQVQFSFLRDSVLVDLVSFQTKITFNRSFGETDHYDYLIGRLFDKSLIYFDQWMSGNMDKNPLLIKYLQLNIKPDYRVDNPVNGDTVFWSPKYKLSWKDFKGEKPVNSKFAAQVFTNFEYNASANIREGILIIDLELKAYVLKSGSWTSEMLSDYNLAHEQLHFDITKLIIERFKEKIKDSLTIDDYDSELQITFIEMYRELNRLQKGYDAESNHSINFVGQQKWQSFISDELRTIRSY
jgi:hypothetical protein